jgi:hypothetical protein
MATALRSILAVARLGVIIVTLTACETASRSLTPSVSTTTLMAGWDHWFSLEWSLKREPGGTNRITGHITNQYGEASESVRLLAQALDASGAVVGQRIAYVPEGVGGFGRRYFEVRRLPVADRYQVTVWDYSFRQAASILR